MMSHTDTDLHYMCALSGSKERAVLTGGGVDFEPFASPISKEICGLQMKDSTSEVDSSSGTSFNLGTEQAVDLCGQCPVCKEGVYNSCKRIQIEGVHYHDACFEISGDDASGCDSRLGEQLRGVCPHCRQGVYTDQERCKDDSGNYYHMECSVYDDQFTTSSSDDILLMLAGDAFTECVQFGALGKLRGECPKCGRGVYTSQDRVKDDTGHYYHETCAESADSVSFVPCLQGKCLLQ